MIVHEKLLAAKKCAVPASLDYARQAAAHSKVNTPPTFAIIVALRMLAWLRSEGGLAAAATRNVAKSDQLYAVIDEDDFYQGLAARPYRSSISVCFRLHQPALDQRFLAEAQDNGLFHLQGHPSIGGIRACLYNSVATEAAQALANFMSDFKRRRG